MSVPTGDFPEPPEGSPGGVRSAARSIGEAGRSFEAVAQGINAASGAIAADWQGWAAGSYMSCARGLATAISTGTDTFDACEEAISAYADALERAQDEIKRLRGLWIEAKEREAAAADLASSLAGQIPGAKPSEVGGLESQITSANADEAAAGDDAASLVRRAYEVLDEFEREAEAQEGVLSGESQNPFDGGLGMFGGGVGTGLLGPGFGIPPGGLGLFGGVISVEHPTNRAAKGPGEWILGGFGDQYKTEETAYESTNIPGYTAYWSELNGRSPDALLEDHSLINPVYLLSGGLAGRGAAAVRSAAARIAGGSSMTGRGEAVAAAAAQAERETAAILGLGAPTRNAEAAIKASGRNAAAAKQLEIDGAQAAEIKNALDLASKAGVPLPPGAADVASAAIQTQAATRFYLEAQLLRAQAWLEAHNSTLSIRAQQVVERAIEAVRR